MPTLLRAYHEMREMRLCYCLYDLPRPLLWSDSNFPMLALQPTYAFLLDLFGLYGLHCLRKQLICYKHTKSMLIVLCADPSVHPLLISNCLPYVPNGLHSQCCFPVPGVHCHDEQLHNVPIPNGLHSVRCRHGAGRAFLLLPRWYDLLHGMLGQQFEMRCVPEHSVLCCQ